MSNYKHLLLPTDMTDPGEPAVDRAKLIRDLTGAELTVLHVVDYVPPGWVANQLPEGLGTESVLVKRAQEQLSEWVKQTGLEKHPQKVLAGSAKRIIVNTATEIGADLIVMGTHGDRGIARIVGSTARAVLHDAPCDVLIVHMA